MIREVMRIELPRMGHEVTVCDGGQAAISAVNTTTYDAAIVDLRMPGIDGWQVVDHIKSVSPETQIIIHTAHGDVTEAIQAVRRGANDFLQKPCKLFDIQTVLQRVAERRNLTHKTLALETRLRAVEGPADLVGDSAPMQRVRTLIDRIAPTTSNVLILGDTGTGKELAARRIHDLSQRATQPFVAVNCGALPEQLVESELFGHRKGAFTGADVSRKGLLGLFFLIRDGGGFAHAVRRAIPLAPAHKRDLIDKFTAVIRATVKGNLLVAVIQGALGGLAFWFLGVGGALLWAVLMAFLSLVPAVGAALVWLPVALYFLATGAHWQGLALIAWGVLVIGLIDNLLRPLLVGKDTGMPDYVVMITTLGGMAVFGINGFVLGPAIAAMFFAVWEIYARTQAGTVT